MSSNIRQRSRAISRGSFVYDVFFQIISANKSLFLKDTVLIHISYIITSLSRSFKAAVFAELQDKMTSSQTKYNNILILYNCNNNVMTVSKSGKDCLQTDIFSCFKCKVMLTTRVLRMVYIFQRKDSWILFTLFTVIYIMRIYFHIIRIFVVLSNLPQVT